MKNTGTLNVTTPTDREIAMTRVFDAPRHLVFEAYTKPELLKRWLGVLSGWSLAVCEIDLRVGGTLSLRVAQQAERNEMGMGGVFREIVPPERIVATEKFDEPGTRRGRRHARRSSSRTARRRSRSRCSTSRRKSRDAVLKSRHGGGRRGELRQARRSDVLA